MATNFFKVNRGITLAVLSSPPANPINGDIYYDSTLNSFQFYEAGAWVSLAATNTDNILTNASGEVLVNSSGNVLLK